MQLRIGPLLCSIVPLILRQPNLHILVDVIAEKGARISQSSRTKQVAILVKGVSLRTAASHTSTECDEAVCEAFRALLCALERSAL